MLAWVPASAPSSVPTSSSAITRVSRRPYLVRVRIRVRVTVTVRVTVRVRFRVRVRVRVPRYDAAQHAAHHVHGQRRLAAGGAWLGLGLGVGLG